MTRLSRKQAGAYYTPDPVVSNLVRWAVRKETDRLLDPSCGDGRFIAAHRNSFGVEQDTEAVAVAMDRAPWGVVHEGDFFAWAACTNERFECAAGNPPFIRYQTFKGEVRRRALDLCAGLGAKFSGLTGSWAPFLVATANLLKPGGRMAFVVPAAIGHAPYAAPLLDYLVTHFDTIRITAIRSKLFPELSENCWLLQADGFGGRSKEFRFGALDHFKPSAAPCETIAVPVREWHDSRKRRLRPYLLPGKVREFYRAAASSDGSMRFGDIATIGIGYVSGANDFFHLRPSEAEAWRIPEQLLHPTVRNSRVLPTGDLTAQTVEGWRRCDDPMMLLRIPKNAELPTSVSQYLDTDRGQAGSWGIQVQNAHPLVLGPRRAGARFLPDLHVRTHAESGPKFCGGDLHERRAQRSCARQEGRAPDCRELGYPIRSAELRAGRASTRRWCAETRASRSYKNRVPATDDGSCVVGSGDD